MDYISFRRFLNATIFAVAIFMAMGCSQINDLSKAHTKTEELFQEALKKRNVHNAFLRVYSPSHQIDWNFVGGQFQNGEAVSTSNPFYTASIGKTVTATAISVLVEHGKLKFEDQISNYLPDSVLNGLHVFEGKDYSREITIAQLLQHTSGLPDYFEDQTIDDSPNVMELMLTDTSRFWTPMETIEFAKEKMKPHFVPGTDYHYTDTEYVLLGMIIQQVSGMSLGDFFKEHFLEPLKMNHSYLNLRSEPVEKTARLSEVYAGDFEASTIKSLSADWAGGGLVSTGSDLVNFLQALFSGKIISQQTLKTMQDWIPETHGMDYGFGLRKISFREFFPTLPDLTVIGHSGSNGSFMYYCPELDVYIAGTLDQTEEVRNSVVLMVKVLAIIQKTENQ